MSYLADPKTWQPAVGASEASALVARLVGFLASKCSLFPRLAQMLLAACPPASHKQHQSQQQQQSVMSIPETLASNLAVRFLSLKRFPEVAAAQAGMAKLLCVPLLWLRCPHVLFSVSITSNQTLLLHTHRHNSSVAVAIQLHAFASCLLPTAIMCSMSTSHGLALLCYLPYSQGVFCLSATRANTLKCASCCWQCVAQSVVLNTHHFLSHSLTLMM